jgi:hypothetical protein
MTFRSLTVVHGPYLQGLLPMPPITSLKIFFSGSNGKGKMFLMKWLIPLVSTEITLHLLKSRVSQGS